jgi:hypothetical protein
MNNAGMLVEEVPGRTTLRCSDGVGYEPSFDDLVVTIEWELPPAACTAELVGWDPRPVDAEDDARRFREV